MGSVLAIDALLRDPRLWRGQDSPAPAPSRQASGFAAFDAALPAGGWPESALVEVPTVIGWLRPVILLPASALAGLTPTQMEALLENRGRIAGSRSHEPIRHAAASSPVVTTNTRRPPASTPAHLCAAPA